MNRMPGTRNRGHRELWVVGLLVLPLVVLGFVLAAMGVLVDPPPDPTPTIERSSPTASPGTPEATPEANAMPAAGRPEYAPGVLISVVA